MPISAYTYERLSEVVSRSITWNDLMRQLGFDATGSRRKSVQRAVAEFGIDTSHFKQRSPWRKYPDDLIAEVVASSTTLREVVEKLGARPATGTLSHIRRRIAAAGIDVRHFPNMDRPDVELPFTDEELTAAATASTSVRAMARALGAADDSRTRAALRRRLTELDVSVTHFSHTRITIPEERLCQAVAAATSFADVMRALDLPVNDVNHRRVQRRTVRLGLDTAHFTRRTRRVVRPVEPRRVAAEVLRVRPQGSPRVNHERLRRALDEVGAPYRCAFCGNAGEWRGGRITLQIDHINGDWLDNRRRNLRYLCPNCHALTPTWCRNRPRTGGLA